MTQPDQYGTPGSGQGPNPMGGAHPVSPGYDTTQDYDPQGDFRYDAVGQNVGPQGGLQYGEARPEDSPLNQGYGTGAGAPMPAGQANQGQRVAAEPVRQSSEDRHPQDTRGLGEIMSDLTRDFSTLMRQEVALAKAELTQSAKSAGKGAGLLGGAGVAGHMALLFGSLALWWLIAHLLDDDAPRFGWSFLIVAALWGIVAAIMAMQGKSEFQQIEGAPQTTETIKQIPDAVKGNEEKNR